MKALVKLNLTLEIIFVGVDREFITPTTAINIIFEKPYKLSENILVDLDLSKSTKIEFCECLLKCIRDYDNTFAINSIKYLENLQKWQLFFLIDIYQSQKDIGNKLIDIENLWAFFDYPNQWESFIYYLPNLLTSSPEETYEVFCNYIISQISSLNITN
jgi:hypothetical protein